MKTDRDEFVAGLRLLADWLEAHEDARWRPALGCVIYDHVSDREALVERARRLGGHWEKQFSDIAETVRLARRFGPEITYLIDVPRDQVCKRVILGTREVEQPDEEAVQALPMVKSVEEIVEWRCPDALFADTEPDVVVEGAA